VASPASESTDEGSKIKTKGKSKAKAQGKELINDAHLRLKAGVRYGLLGRNGTGKSSTRISPALPLALLIILVISSSPSNG